MAYEQTYFDTCLVYGYVMTFRRVNAFGKLLKDYIMVVCVYYIVFSLSICKQFNIRMLKEKRGKEKNMKIKFLSIYKLLTNKENISKHTHTHTYIHLYTYTHIHTQQINKCIQHKLYCIGLLCCIATLTEICSFKIKCNY